MEIAAAAIPFYERAIARAENSLSILIGHSFGGLFAFDTLLHRPAAFTGYLNAMAKALELRPDGVCPVPFPDALPSPA